MAPNLTGEAPAGRWLRWTILAVLGALLFAMGQFDDAIYAGLTRGWLALTGRAGGQAASAAPDVSQHLWAVALAYRLLYYGLNVAALHVLLRGRGTRQIALGYGALLVVCLGLLLGGHAARLPWVAGQVHNLLGIVCSPLALMLIYGSAALARQPAARSGFRKR